MRQRGAPAAAGEGADLKVPSWAPGACHVTAALRSGCQQPGGWQGPPAAPPWVNGAGGSACSLRQPHLGRRTGVPDTTMDEARPW